MNSSNEMTIGFIGNPNCGKTTLFNAYTGANLKVANWPGVTVEKVSGAIKEHNETIHLVDLPGTYSLTSYTMEETVSRQFILSDEVDVIINVVDASALERSLYLTLQLLELGKPVVMALNMMDIVTKRGMEIDMHRLPEMLGIPVIPVTARKRQGLAPSVPPHGRTPAGSRCRQDDQARPLTPPQRGCCTSWRTARHKTPPGRGWSNLCCNHRKQKNQFPPVEQTKTHLSTSDT